jgi:hypothetical protein
LHLLTIVLVIAQPVTRLLTFIRAGDDAIEEAPVPDAEPVDNTQAEKAGGIRMPSRSLTSTAHATMVLPSESCARGSA